LISANTRLVFSLARKWWPRATSAFDTDDFFQEGCLGLIRASEKFDPGLGYRFSTYATWWIRQAIHRGYADKSRTVRLPVHVIEALGKIARLERGLEDAGVSPLSTTGTQSVAAKAEISVDQLRYLRTIRRPVLYLEEIEDVEDRTFDLDEIAAAELRTLVLREVLQKWLSDRERRVLELRYGLNNEHPRTLDEVGRMFDLTRERIRQIETQAFKKVLACDDAQRLRANDSAQQVAARELAEMD
jgi:RNA polymerase primary sigma factor